MNQILSTENNYNNRKQKNSTRVVIDMKKIIIIFSALIIVFALFIGIIKISTYIKDKKKKNLSNAILNKPNIEVEETGNLCVLKVSYDDGLEEVTYWWNDENIRKRSLNGQTDPYITNIEIPSGQNNTLHIKAVGRDGSINEYSYNAGTSQSGPSSEDIIIKYNFNQDANELIITASCEKGIKELTYKRDEEETQVISNTGENQKEISTTIPINRGVNRFYITATDTYGNVKTEEKTFLGTYDPEIEIRLENNSLLVIKITHDKGFKKVVIHINGLEYVYDETNEQYDPNAQDLNIQCEVQPGMLKVDFSIYTLERPDYEYRVQTEPFEVTR